MASEEFHALQERMAAAPPPDPDISLEQRRAGIDAVMGALPLAEGVSAADLTLGSVPAIECEAAGAAPDHPVILYLHGGGFRIASALSYRAYGSHLARALGGSVVLVDYRLAPEHPFPAALDDTVAAYRALLDGGVAPGRIVVAGDSAGGNLAAAAVLVIAREGLPAPAGVVCCSPWVDLTNSGESYRTRAEVDTLWSRTSAGEAARLYLGDGADARNPLVSPVLGDWRGAPPALIQVGDAETLLDDSAALEAAMATGGVDVVRHVYPEMPHVWQLSYPAFPEAVDAVAELVSFVRRVTSV